MHVTAGSKAGSSFTGASAYSSGSVVGGGASIESATAAATGAGNDVSAASNDVSATAVVGAAIGSASADESLRSTDRRCIGSPTRPYFDVGCHALHGLNAQR